MLILVFVDETVGAAALKDSATIVHTASPRLFVARVDLARRSDLASRPGVIAMTEGTLPDEVANRLNKAEALFATAFANRRTSKERPGEGLPWDAPGFEPPDSPD